MENYLNSIKHFSVEPAVRNLYRNDEQKRLGDLTNYNRSRDKLGDFRYDQRLKQQNESRDYQRGRQVKADTRNDQLFNMKINDRAEANADKLEQAKNDKLVRVAYVANTPEKWGKMIGGLRSSGVNFPEQYNDFGSRDSVLAEYGDLNTIVGLFKQRQGAENAQQSKELGRLNIDIKRADLQNKLNQNQGLDNLNGFKDKKQKLSAQSDFRKEYTRVSGDFVKVRDAQARIEASATDPSAAGDLALIFNFMKVLDPGSTVREGEFATAQNSAGVPDRVRAQWNALINGQKLTTVQRGDFLNRSRALFGRQRAQYVKNRGIYKSIAERNGLDVQSVLPDLSSAITEEKKTPIAETPKSPPRKTAVDAQGNRIELNPDTNQWEPVR